jgi:hypothetical protein
MQTVGASYTKSSNMADVMNHSYLHKSMEQRVQRKVLYNEYLRALKSNYSSTNLKETNASKLRSQSILDSLSKGSSNQDVNSRGPKSISQDRYSNTSSMYATLAHKNKLEILHKANQRMYEASN